jgi:hypothetical protein
MVAAVGWQLDAGMVAFADFSDTLSMILRCPCGGTGWFVGRAQGVSSTAPAAPSPLRGQRAGRIDRHTRSSRHTSTLSPRCFDRLARPDPVLLLHFVREVLVGDPILLPSCSSLRRHLRCDGFRLGHPLLVFHFRHPLHGGAVGITTLHADVRCDENDTRC